MRGRNKGKRVVMILDNFRAHTSWKTRGAAEALGIELVFLLHHIRPIRIRSSSSVRRSITRELSAIFLKWREEVRGVVEALFYELAGSLSFAKRRIEKFLSL